MRTALPLFLLCTLAIVPASGQITDSIFYGNTPVLHENPFGWGYIAGTNEYLDGGKYQRFDWFGNEYIVAARLVFGFKRVVTIPDSLWVVIRDCLPDGSPGDVLSRVGTTTDQLDTTGAGNVFFFPDPPQFQGIGFVADSLFVGFEWVETEDDTFAVMADSDGEGDQMQRAWERIADGSGGWIMWPWWNSPDPNFEWNLDADLWITAYLSPTSPVAVTEKDQEVPQLFSLSQNFPNPFNPATVITYELPEASHVSLKVYTTLGEEVAVLVDQHAPPGRYLARWNAAGMASGMYFCRMQAGTFTATRQMLLAK